MLQIQHIDKESDELQIIRTLFGEYAAELNEDLCFQRFDAELTNPLSKYGTPKGSLLLAYWHREAAGCIALQALPDNICEMKRLYVRPAYRKHKIGDELVKAILKEGEEKGYGKMVLDTLEKLEPAIRLYEKNGFANTSAYYKNPLSQVVFMEKLLL